MLETLRSQRLGHARIVCEAGGMPLTEIAFRVGYNHVTKFISVFTARYGAPPRRYLDGGAASLPRRAKGLLRRARNDSVHACSTP